MRRDKSLIHWMLHYIKDFIGLFISHLFMAPAQYLTKIFASAIGFEWMLEGLLQLSVNLFLRGIGIYIIGILCSGIFYGLDVWLSGKLECLLRIKIKKELLDSVLTAEKRAGKQQIHSGQLMDICTTDVEKISTFPGTQLGDFVAPIIVSFVCIFALMIRSFLIAGITLLSMAISLVLNIYFMPKYRIASEETRKEEATFVSKFEEEIMGIAIIRVFSRQKEFLLQMSDNAQMVYKLQDKEVRIRFVHGILINLLAFSSMTIPFILGAILVTRGDMKTSELMYVTQISGNLLWFMDTLARTIMNVQKVLVSGERIKAIIEQRDEVQCQGKISVKEAESVISLHNVSVAYGEKKVLNNISIEIPRGMCAAFVGESGSGKSTILKVIEQLVPYSGEVMVLGQNVEKLEKSTVRALMSYASQDVRVINGSIFENILLGNLEADQSEIERAAENALVNKFTENLKTGYYTQIEELGSNLSGGEKQRIALARCFLRKAPIVLLDEVTSALDSETECGIMNYVEKLRKDATVLIVAQKLNTIVNADIIYVIKNGTIAECGTHSELLGRHGEYERLFKEMKG